ncbi:MAG: high-potential iron-sulfur protein [Gammaproteobacteria bacterium]|nr:high-potential iron-sulfur protein [Gammaproteobacteria bacterium]
MNNAKFNNNRRRLLFTAAATAAAVPFMKALVSNPAYAEMVQLEESDPTAQALKYHHDAAAAPRADKAGTAAAEQFCSNCMFIQGEAADWQPCALFPGKTVNANGWCSSWTKKAG